MIKARWTIAPAFLIHLQLKPSLKHNHMSTYDGQYAWRPPLIIQHQQPLYLQKKKTTSLSFLAIIHY